MKMAGAWRGGCGSEGGGADSVGTRECDITHSMTPRHTHSLPSLLVPGPSDVRNGALRETTEHVLSAGSCSSKSTISCDPPNSPIFHSRELRLEDKTIAKCQSQTGLSDTRPCSSPGPTAPPDLLPSCLQETLWGVQRKEGASLQLGPRHHFCPHQAFVLPLRVIS